MSFTLLLNHTLLHRIGWALIHSLWQGALIAVVYALSGVALRKQAAQARYLAGCLALALLAASPVITFISSSEEARARVEMNTGGSALVRSVSAAAVPSTVTPGGSGELPDWLVAVTDRVSELTPWLALGWALGVLVSAGHLTRSFWWLRKLQVSGNEPIHGDWIGTLNRLRVRFGVSRPVRLCKSALVEVPTVLGWLRPVILLPTSSVMGLTFAQLESILAHELAHVRRFDYLVNAAQCMLEALLFYHPVVWWISRHVRQERENCCDDLVVEICGNKLGYARALAAMEELRGQAPDFAFAANGGSLLMRIRRLLGAAEQDGTSPARRAGGLALIGMGLLLILLGVLMHLSLPRYEAVARIKLDGIGPDGSTHGSYDPYFIQTEFEVIQSEPVLRRVVDDLGLAKKWRQKNEPNGQLKNAESLVMLRAMLSIRPLRNTSFVEIGAYSRDPQEARDIANAVAQSYRNYHIEQRTDGKARELKELETRAEEQQQRINEAQDRVDELRANLGILDGTTDSNGSSSAITVDTLRKLESLRVENEAQLTREETLLAGLKNLDFDKLTQVLPTAAPDTLLTSLLERALVAEQGLATAQNSFGPEHPEVIAAKMKLEDLHKKIHQRVEGIMLGLEERVNSLKHGSEKLTLEAEGFRKTEMERSLRSRPYFKAKRELDELERAGDSLNTSLVSARLRLAAPMISTVEIMDVAEVPFRPVFPNRPKATACIVLGILLSLFGFGMLRKPRGLSFQPAAAAA